MTRGSSRPLTVEFEGDQIVLEDLEGDELIIPILGNNIREIGKHEGCGGGACISLDRGGGLMLSCDRAMCHLEIRGIPLGVDTPRKLRVYLRDTSYFSHPVGRK